MYKESVQHKQMERLKGKTGESPKEQSSAGGKAGLGRGAEGSGREQRSLFGLGRGAEGRSREQRS